MKVLPLLRASLTLRKVKARLPRLRGMKGPVLDEESVRAKLASKLAGVTGATAGQAGPHLESYVDNHVADWLDRMAVHHRTLLAELDALAVHLAGLKERYRIQVEDQKLRVDDLEGAVSHALKRVSDPDSPFHEPEPRSNHRGANG
ncbi:hypothetical protein [Actinocrispum wychmicini]|uniref:Excreted virulence factor EspC (Type VII ESX diderm) n=1 Tax=Actinocrispum wychmicini TaxID=1213861 RepID=A0A4R2J477_9PSEU|nr:hypothetical protein [Actinocrispum wychmicini]TCO52914.1 hypothetical protein EV192_111108 [Actinocrispum wychmicini]